MQAQWKLSRAYGIANLLILHRLSDLDADRRRRQRGAGDRRGPARRLLDPGDLPAGERPARRDRRRPSGLTGTERDLLPALPRGTGLWKVAGRSYVVRHRLHVDELDLFDTDAAMRDIAR